MPKAPIYRGHRLPGQSTTRGITAPVTVQRVVQVGNTPPQQIPTTENDPVIRGSWRFVPAGTDDTTMAMLGNLDGYYGYAAATFGMAIGEYATGKPNITIEDVNGLRIRNYETAVLTLDLLGNAAFEGEITAASGEIGGWTIGAADLTGGDATLAAAGTLTLGTGDDVIVLDASAALYRLWAGDAVAADAPFSVTKAGVLAATSGTIGGWTLSAASLTGGDAVLAAAGSLTLGTGDDVAVLSAADALYRLWAGDATPADAPFSVTKLGDLVARNADIRGTIRTSVFELGQVQATAGTQLVTKSAGKIATDYVVQDNLLVIETPEAGGWLFETDDWIRITAMPIGGAVVGTTWVQVTRTATLNEYATSGSLDGATYPAGTVAVDYGQSGDGLLLLTADDANGPFYSVRTHAGEPWTLTERARLGNLNGIFGNASDVYGVAIGDYAAGNYLTYDPTGGFHLSAADGGIEITEDAFIINASTSFGDYYLRWVNGGVTTAFVDGAYGSDIAFLNVLALGKAGGDGAELWLVADDADGDTTGLYLIQSTTTEIQAFVNDVQTLVFTPTEAHFLQNVRYTGNLESYKGATTYSGYIYVPLATPATNESWDGDDKTSTDRGVLDLSALYGIPAGVKAVNVFILSYATVAGKQCLLSMSSDLETIQLLQRHRTADLGYPQTGVVNCDANGDIYYWCDTGATFATDIRILGYWI